MTLGELIETLSNIDPQIKVTKGFNNAHSYRGYYDELAFEPCEDTTVGEMLTCAEGALGETFTGWKGGEYQMREHTDVWLAEIGCTGEGIGPTLIDYMTAGGAP